jgi:MFS family permease
MTPHQRICLAAFLFDFAMMIGIVVLPFYVYNQIGGDAAMSGVFGASQAAAYALLCLVSVKFVSRAKNGLNWAVLGVTVFAVSSILIPAFRDPIICGAVATVSMAAAALFWPALHAWVGAEPDVERRAHRMSWFNISWSSGFAISPLFAGPLYDYDYRLPFLLLFATCIPIFILLRSMPREKDHFGVAAPEVIEARAGHDRASEAHLYAAWCATVVGSALGGVTRTVYPKRIDDLVASGQLRILFEETPASILTSGAATKYSWLAFALALTAAITFLVLGRTRGWQHNFKPLIVLQLAAAVAFWILGNTRSLLVMMACFVVVGCFASVAFFSSVFYSMADPDHRHRRAAINEGAVGAGTFAGSLVFGYLAGRYGLSVPFHYTPAFIAVALVAQILLLKHGAHKHLV